MIGKRPLPADRLRQALTLLEMLLVLCLLSVLVALAWPSLNRPMANQRLRKAADRVRAEWGRARVEAMSSGQTYLFRYVPETDRYSIQCRAGPDFAPDVTDGEGVGVVGEEMSPPAAPRQTERTLPDGVTFVAGQTKVDTRSQMIESQVGGLQTVEGGWSRPVLFYPDGTTSSARLLLKNKHDRYIELALRGLTGVVTVGQLHAAEERLP